MESALERPYLEFMVIDLLVFVQIKEFKLILKLRGDAH